MYAKEMREGLARIAAQMRVIVDTAKAEDNRGLTSEEAEKFDRIEKDYSNLEATIARAEKVIGIENDLRNVDPAKIAAAVPAAFQKPEAGDLHAKSFSNFLRNGIDGLEADEKQFMASKFVSNAGGTAIRNTMSTTTSSQGGYVVPTGFSDELEKALKFYGGILENVGEIKTETGNTLPWPTVNDTANKGRIIGQNAQVTNTDVSFGSVSFGAYIFSSDAVLVPLALLQDSYFNLDALIASLLGERLGRLLNNKLTVGGGTTEPIGLSTAAVTAAQSVGGASGQTSSVIYDDLVDLEHKVDPAYRSRAKYMFHDTTLKVIKKLKDGNLRPLWQPGINAGFGAGMPSTILDHEYIINNDVATMSASAVSILFGDFSKYKARRVAGGTTVMRLVERYADYLQVGYIGFLRADGNLLDAGTHPVAYYTNAAS
jgi:HK97 family phage major capsid protein